VSVSPLGLLQIGYAVFDVADVAAWEQFATRVLGMEISERDADGSIYLRMDERAYRIALHPAATNRLTHMGWELADTDRLSELTAGLRAGGVAVRDHGPEEAAARRVVALASVDDPDGYRVEFYCALGFGHLTLSASENLAALLAFYRDRLGLCVSDYITLAARGPGAQGLFFHCNARHHSLALIHLPGVAVGNVLHLMLEVNTLDDVGLMLERCYEHNVPIMRGLGRHSNDKMVSAYIMTPSGFEIEYGWGAREIDDATWSVERHDVVRVWGAESSAHEIERMKISLKHHEDRLAAASARIT
jgi:3,4-dihydroxy-9,10-secoandrosta-1,3,5(10)-triene-9,17-dione 4,5-dioxygenase